jgi:hypothetical protein
MTRLWLTKRVADVFMAVNAVQHFAISVGHQHFVNRRSVAVKTRILRHAPIPGLDLNWFVKIFERERQRVKKAIVRFGQPFTGEVMRQMAIVAHGNMPMA